MAIVHAKAGVIRGIVSSVPKRRVDNLTDVTGFERAEVEKVVRTTGVKSRHITGESECSSDLCIAAARRLLELVKWEPESVDGLIFVTQTPDYFVPSTCSIAHGKLGLKMECAAFDVGLGCSGYPYGLWLATTILQGGGLRRVLLLHGETPTKFSDKSDRAVALLFGDAGSATAIEASDDSKKWLFSLHSDGSGVEDLIIRGGGFRARYPEDRRQEHLSMHGANVFNFTIQRVPPLIEETLAAGKTTKEDVDYFIFHQSSMLSLRHLTQTLSLEEEKVPIIVDRFGNTGGVSLPLTITGGRLKRPVNRDLRLLLAGYGSGLSWGSALVDLEPNVVLEHVVLT